MSTTPLPPKKPEALRIADELDCHNANLDRRARKELRRQHAEIEQLTQARADLEAENARLREALEAILDEQNDNEGYAKPATYDAARAALENRA